MKSDHIITALILGLVFIFSPGKMLRNAITGPAPQQTTTQQAR